MLLSARLSLLVTHLWWRIDGFQGFHNWTLNSFHMMVMRDRWSRLRYSMMVAAFSTSVCGSDSGQDCDLHRVTN